MEGLLIAEQLRTLAPLLPAERLPWRFQGPHTFVLPLVGDASLIIESRPPHPLVRLGSGAPAAGRPATPFQEQLVARAPGRLLAATQRRLDRVFELEFAEGEGFVPTPPVRLVVELTGRNANLVLVDMEGSILGVQRPVSAAHNRYRQLRAGVPYVPPPPYEKLDPRTAADEELGRVFAGRTTREVGALAQRAIDGIGPSLAAALARGVEGALAEAADGAAPDSRLEGEALSVAVAELRALTAEPAAYLERHAPPHAPAEMKERERAGRHLRAAEGAAKREVKLARRRLADAKRALAGEADAAKLRSEGDLLLAYAHQVPAGADRVTLEGWGGESVELTLDPKLDASGNAQRRYEQAKRREARARRAREQLPELEEALSAAEAALEELPELGSAELARRARAAEEAARKERSRAAQPGIRFRGPHGFEVVVGRNSRENDVVTFRVARSRDLWFHAQGYRGSHVIVRSGGKEVPFDTVLFAARLAAGYSEAFRSDNVAVDYTERKNVWKVKGGPPGAVNFTQHRTVYVTPARDDAGALGGKAEA